MTNLIERIFSNPPKEPFSLDMTLNLKDSKIDTLYSYIKELYLSGLIYLTRGGFKGDIVIKDIKQNHLITMEKYMLSIGITTSYTIYTPENVDLISRDFLYETKKINNLDIKVILDWKKDIINKIAFKVQNLTNDELKQFYLAVKKHHIVNIIYKFIPPSSLKDNGFIIKDGENIHIFYFDFADRAKYQQKYKFNNKHNF